MNSIKNAIVTVALLVVGYGAYVVLNNPPAHEFETVDQWALADTSLHQEVSLGSPTGIGAPHEEAVAPESPAATSPPGSQPAANGSRDAHRKPAAPSTTATGTQTAPAADSATENAAPPYAEAAPTSSAPEQTAPAGNFYAQAGQAADETTEATPAAEPTAPPDTASGELPETAPLPDLGSAATAEGSPGFEEAWGAVQSHLQADRLADALFALSMWYHDPDLTSEQQQRCQDMLDQLAGTVIYSQESYLEPPYQAQPGETLEQIAAGYGVTPEFLRRINHLNARDPLPAGATLKVVRGPFRAEVSLSRREVTLFLGRYYAGRFAAHLGNSLPEQETIYEVIEKSDGREYFDPRSGFRIERDDPQNLYGARWIGLRGDQVTAADNVGIHVWNEQLGSEGCIGVAPLDADDLSVILMIGSRVAVVP